MTDPYEYDVFISFSSADEEIAKPIWQALCSNGLRVFWSDAALKKEVGNSWFEVIEKSLERSRHMLLICSDNSMNSKWVQREYRAFLDYCYSPNLRRLIPLLAREFQPNSLPLFLRQLQVGKINDSQFIEEIIPILGGTNIEKLQREIQSLKEQLDLLSIENESLRKKSEAESNRAAVLEQQSIEAKELINKLSNENVSLREQGVKLAHESDLPNKALHEQNQLLSSENRSLEARITSLINDGDVAKKKSKERENSLLSENVLLKKQVAKLTKENNILNQKLTEQENSLSGENSLPTEQIDEFKKEIDSQPKSSPTIKKNKRSDQLSPIVHPRAERIRELLNELDRQEAYIRIEAVQELSNIEFPLQNSQRSLVIRRIESLASTDPNSEVRTAAALALLSLRGKSK
jgi:hypothetical protein